MKGKKSYHAERVEGQEDFRTVGVLLLVGNDVLYVPVVEDVAPVNLPQERMSNEIAGALERNLDPDDIFDYYIERSNGITDSFSLSETIQGKTIEEIKQKALDSIRH